MDNTILNTVRLVNIGWFRNLNGDNKNIIWLPFQMQVYIDSVAGLIFVLQKNKYRNKEKKKLSKRPSILTIFVFNVAIIVQIFDIVCFLTKKKKDLLV